MVAAEIGYAVSSRSVHPYQYTPLEDGQGGPFEGLANSSNDYDQFIESLEELQDNIRAEKTDPSHKGEWKF